MTHSTTVRVDQADLLGLVDAVPDFDGFPPIDELNARFEALAAAHPELVSAKRVATSRLGESITMYSIGSGSLSHLIVGGVHPNEPIGFWTALHLAETACTDPAALHALDATWHIIPCIDPDGARLNEGWFAAPGDRNFYARRFYRPAPDQQVEWSFPTSYKRAYFDRVMPETQGLMRVIDELRPHLYVSLHNGEMGGVYYYLSRPVPELYDALHSVPAHLGLPLDTGEPEAPHYERYAPAIFGTGHISSVYDYLEGLGLDPTLAIGGSSSSEYAERHGTLSLVAELPYWSHPDADDSTATAESYPALLRRTAAGLRETHELLGSLLDRAEGLLTLRTPFLEASRAFIPMFERMADADVARAERADARPATVAERFGCEDLVHCFRLRYGGMLLRAFEAEAAAGTAPAELRRLTKELESLYGRWQAEPSAGDEAAVIPIKSLVGVQYGAILATAMHVKAAAS